MTATSFAQIPRGVLAHLLDLCGDPENISPRFLMGDAAEINPLQIAQLYGGGYLSKAKLSRRTLAPLFKQAADVLLSPRTNLTIRLWGADDACVETNVQFPEGIAEGGGVMLLPVSGTYQMSAFIEPEDIIGTIAAALPPGEGSLENPFVFEGHFEAPVASVLFALIDLHRNTTRRRAGFAAADVFGYLEGQWGLTGANQLSTYVQAVGMQSSPPAIIEVEHALAQLAAAGAVEERGAGQFQISADLRPLVALTRSLAAGLQWECVTQLEDGSLRVNSRLFIYGDGGLTLCLIPAVKGRFLIGTVSHGDVLDFVADEVSGLTQFERDEASEEEAPAQVLEEPEPKKAVPRQKKPAAKRKPATASKAKARKKAEGAACASCGAPLSPGAKFCTACGAKVVQAAPEPTCPSCGMTIKPGAKFCTGCGAKL